MVVTKRIYCKKDGCRKYANLNENGFCPTCQPPPAEESEGEEENKCALCNEAIDEESDNVIGCDVCQKLFHPKCAGPAELVQLWDLFAKAASPAAQVIKGTLLWICPDCSQKPEQTIKISDHSCTTVPDKSSAVDNVDQSSGNNNRDTEHSTNTF